MAKFYVLDISSDADETVDEPEFSSVWKAIDYAYEEYKKSKRTKSFEINDANGWTIAKFVEI